MLSFPSRFGFVIVFKILKKLKTPEKPKTDKSKSARKRAESESEDELAADTEVIPLSTGSKAVMKIVDYLKSQLNLKPSLKKTKSKILIMS